MKPQFSLHKAIVAGKQSRALMLIEGRADVNLRDADGFAPLHHASRLPRLEVMMALVKAGADVNALTPTGFTPLHAAAEHGSLSKTRYLLESGANPDARLTQSFNGYPVGATPSDVAAMRGHSHLVRWIEKLVEIL